jgi:hypothetical protein
MKEIVEELFTFFDEQGSSEELLAFSTLCQRVRACLLSGDPLDAPFLELQNRVNDFFRTEQGSVSKVEKALRVMSDFCRFLSVARNARKGGEIETALLFEGQAERTYENLPIEFRW